MRGAGGRSKRFAVVAHPGEPAAIGALQRACIGEEGVGAGGARRAHPVFEPREEIGEGRPGGQPGRDMKPRVAIAEAQRVAYRRVIAAQILARQRAPLVAHVAGDGRTDLAVEELTVTLRGEPVERVGDPVHGDALVRQARPARDGRPLPVFQKHRGGVGIARKPARRRGDDQGGVPVDMQSLARKPDRRLQQLAPRHDAEARMRDPHPIHQPRHGDRRRPLHVAVVHHRLPGEQIARLARARERVVGRIEPARRAHPVIDRVGPPLVRAPDHHRAAAGGTAHPRFGHAHGEGHRDGRVDGVAAGRKRFGADRRRASMLGGDDAALGLHQDLADLLGSGKVAFHVGILAPGMILRPQRSPARRGCQAPRRIAETSIPCPTAAHAVSRPQPRLRRIADRSLGPGHGVQAARTHTFTS